jgi:ankyrin repeat protein
VVDGASNIAFPVVTLAAARRARHGITWGSQHGIFRAHNGSLARVHAGHNIYHSMKAANPQNDETFTDTAEDHTVNNYNPTRSAEILPGSERHQAFSQAVVEGQVPRIRNFLRMGVDVDETVASGLTVLHRAVLSGHQDFGSPLGLAALRGSPEVVALLLRRRASVSPTTPKLGTALHFCVLGAQGRKTTIDALLAARADVSARATIDTRWLKAICDWDGSAQRPVRSQEEFNGRIFHDATPAYIAIRTMQRDLLSCLLPIDLESKFKITFLKAKENTNNSSPHIRHVQKSRFDMTLPPPRHTYLSGSAMTCDLATVRLLIARRVSLQSDSERRDITALNIAAGQGSTEIVRLLLDSGSSVDTSSRARWTALHYAAASGNDHTVRILCDRGAKVDCSHGRPPLWAAPDYMSPGESYRPLQTLLTANADINAYDYQGLTPLHKILRKDPINITALEEFVKAGANTRLMTNAATSILKLLMSIPAPGPALMAIGRGLSYGITFLEIMCDRLNHVREAYEDLNDREHMLLYLSAQAGYEDVTFLLSLGCDVKVIDSDGSTALHSAVEDDDIPAIEALVGAGASLDTYTGDEDPAPLTGDGADNDGAEVLSTPSRDEDGSRGQASSVDITTVLGPQQGASIGIDATHISEGPNTNEPRTPCPSDQLLAVSFIADSLVAESLFAESLLQTHSLQNHSSPNHWLQSQ